MLLSSGGYQKLFEAIKSLGQPTRLMMDSLIAMAIGRDDENGEEHESMVRNVEPIAYLVDWLPGITDHELQFETASAINKLCSSSLQRLFKDNFFYSILQFIASSPIYLLAKLFVVNVDYSVM